MIIKISTNIINSYQNKKIIIAGGRGYIGAHLSAALSPVACQVVLLDHSETNIWLPPSGAAEYIHIGGDLSDEKTWQAALPNTDIIFHLAGIEYRRGDFNHEKDFKNNTGTVVGLLQALRKSESNPQVVFTSSVNIYGVSDGRSVTENTRDNPPSLWSAHKLLAENYLQISSTKGIPSTILRLSNIYGVSARPDVCARVLINRIIMHALISKKLTLYNNNECIRDFLHVDDVISALLVSGTHSDIGRKGDIYIVGSGHSTSFSKAWELIASYIENVIKLPTTIYFDKQKTLEALDYRSFIILPEHFSRTTGWSPEFSLPQGLEKTVNEIFSLLCSRNNGRIPARIN